MADFIYIPGVFSSPRECQGSLSPTPTMSDTTPIQKLLNAPYLSTIPLPSLTKTPPSGNYENRDFFPIRLEDPVQLSQYLELWSHTMTFPIHIHSPKWYMGALVSPTNSHTREVCAVDVVLFLQEMIQAPLLHDIYAQLPHPRQEEIKWVYQSRVGREGLERWNSFLAGIDLGRMGPLGCDLFLGNVEVWGLESSVPGSGSVLHLA